MAKRAFSAYLQCFARTLQDGKYVPKAVMQQQSDIPCWAIIRSKLCFRDPAQWLAGILLKQLTSHGTCFNSHQLPDAVRPYAFNSLSFTSKCCHPRVNAELPFCFEEVVVMTHSAAKHRWISGLTSPAAGFAARVIGQAGGSA